MKLYLQTIVESIQFESLPQGWISFDLTSFSDRINLFDYQEQALKNALKALYKYYGDCEGSKEKFFESYCVNGLATNRLDYKLKDNKNLKIFKDIDNDYEVKSGKVAFHHFINRMSFWMATGSGKTLVIVKLLELLGNLIKNKQIPSNDMLFLTYRDDLIEQFKNHVNKFNSTNSKFRINLCSLRDYEKIKRENRLSYGDEINVFYYRSDLISDEHKDKIVNFKNYDNNGGWYILLDEAHKGDKEDSKRQLYYSILSRNGFLFNFSATFTDPVDFATCVFNFNLEKFITAGYGKHIYISQSNVKALSQKNNFTKKQKKKQKQLIIIKVLLLYTLIARSRIGNYYHRPLILTLVNSVNTEDSDLELFFREIERIARQGIDKVLLDDAKAELKSDLDHNYEFEDEKLKLKLADIDAIKKEDIFKHVFHAETEGSVEVLKIPGNSQELIFKLTTSERPFALIKIGDISDWIKSKLTNYQIIEKFENESVFRNLNRDDSDITLLMGSRAFYEGWDSNRPNIILYINIGKGTDARKFILQSIGRGVRIEPIPNKRKRLQFLHNSGEINEKEFSVLKNKVELLETLFIYGTKAENLKEVIETLKQEKQEELIGDLFEVNPEVKDKLLLVPTYRESEKILADGNYVIKFETNPSDLALVKDYFNHIGEKVVLVKYDCSPRVLKKIKESFLNTGAYYLTRKDILELNRPDLLLDQIFKHFSLRSKGFKEFKQLENEIIHFKQIKLTDGKRKEIEEKIKRVLSFKEKEKRLAKVAEKIQREPQKALEYTKEIENITKTCVKELEMQCNTERIRFKYLPNHYYVPVVLSESEKAIYFMHIIKTKSEVDFINQLEEYLESEDNFFNQFDWWFFSKIDEMLDDVYIPYYQPKTNRIEKFKPDFIFWLKKGDNYTILFVDPKGTEFADGYRKIDGYSGIFEIDRNGQKQSKDFSYNGYTINAKLLLKSSRGVAGVLENYKRYWFDSFNDCASKI